MFWQANAELKDSYVIFICMKDPFGKALPVYTFENTCREDTELFLADKTAKVFYNASAYGKETDDELHALLQYLCKKQATSNFTKNIDELVETTRQNEKFRSLYMLLNIHEDDLRMTGEKIGFEKGIRKGIQKGFTQGARQKSFETARILSTMHLSRADIAKATGLSEDEIKKL